MQHKVESKAEENKQRAIRCTEEIVRREEALKLEKELAKAKDEWKKERQQIYMDAHHSQLRAIAKETAILEKQLRKEFKEELARVREEFQQHLEVTVKQTWEEANRIKESAVADARQEEQTLALQEAERVAQDVEEQRRKALEKAERERKRALADLTESMNAAHQVALAEKEQQMEEEFAGRLREVQDQHDQEIDKLQTELKEALMENGSLTCHLEETTNSRDLWKEKHDNVKKEFSDFIDHCPGFRGEFILK